MNELPRITSIGAPPELHADRIVASMLRVIVSIRAKRWPEAQAVYEAHPKDGNPGAQARLLKRIEKAMRGFVLGSALESGKRGRYKIHLLVLDGWDAEKSIIIGPDDRIPAKPWIAISQVIVTSKGDHRYDETTEVPLLITHHALSRLAQRCGARDLRQVYYAVRAIGAAYIKQMKGRFVCHNERMRVETDLGPVICVLSHHADGNGGIVLTTLWNEEDPE